MYAKVVLEPLTLEVKRATLPACSTLHKIQLPDEPSLTKTEKGSPTSAGL